MDTIKGYFGAKPEVPEKPIALERTPSGTRKSVKELSPLANNVIGRCARILLVRPEDLQEQFDKEAPLSAKTKDKYARSILEYCCFRTLSISAQVEDHLSDVDFRRLTYDMMLAWEAPGSTNKNVSKVEQKDVQLEEAEKVAAALGADDDEEESALFYNDLMPMMAEVEQTVGLEAFTRIAPAVPAIADLVTVYPQWEALTNTTGARLPFQLYDKYLGELDKSIKLMKSQLTPEVKQVLHLESDEILVDTDGGSSGQTVIEHVGSSTYPGRFTVTNYAIYFEVAGILSYSDAKRFDLASDLKYEVKPEVTGPWGTKIFDKAIMFKSNEVQEPLVFEFPEITGHARRDYWIAIIREIVACHKFCRLYKLKGVGKSEALARAVLGIARLRALRETIKVLPTRADSLLTFCYGDNMPHGDQVMGALADTLRHHGDGKSGDTFLDHHEGNKVYSSTATASAASLDLDPTPHPTSEHQRDALSPVNEVMIGEETALEKTVLDSRENTKKVEKAEATVDSVKGDGIGRNVQILTELLKPIPEVLEEVQSILQWKNPTRTIAVATVVFLFIVFDLLSYIPTVLLLSAAVYIFYLRYLKKKEKIRSGEVLIPVPQGTSTVEALTALQQAVSQAEATIQGINIALLKIRALLLSNYPEASNQVAALLAAAALGLAVLPTRWLVFIVFVNTFTSGLQGQRESPSTFERRFNEWWYSIPVVPVRFLKPGEDVNVRKLD
ncbi:uncharacterized protein [Physcomitrium patens]|uniref:GRAM domain-containing protein n=1 Tax=Physcomitrium patens TaxID=3218 RepID=A0A2K1L348_PHYPA|nr:uncharacterized protein LOC112278924 [Physcomitrium patens]XP_024368613.1 uncharacterized protein LOC112278924 [Physcomitrium patens]XP_024368614.1 uncharacterized protein LOC112278924 [Physcomitrium patens]XP_024368615.1 uncharacterized protein LOC112278924 [Physcomitrium patens]XP_024368616.1 uncharacterized protein LOC112278924 [Physcomitrium patens]PNR60443.1 hypothetical protein PHYPA_003236 [Physcomitrium patens]|eukprot:XP_024368612.1 uncharacterized protein LOC112278924 [Physcomitrella patens]